MLAVNNRSNFIASLWSSIIFVDANTYTQEINDCCSQKGVLIQKDLFIFCPYSKYMRTTM